MIEKPFDWSRLAPGKTIFHFLGLLSDVAVNRPMVDKSDHSGKFVWQDCPQRVRRDPENGAVKRRDCRLAGLDKE